MSVVLSPGRGRRPVIGADRGGQPESGAGARPGLVRRTDWRTRAAHATAGASARTASTARSPERRRSSPTVLERHVAGHQHVEYRLTAAGHALQEIIDALGGWGAQWAFGEPRPIELDPVVLLWWMRRRVRFERLAPRRVVAQFEFRGERRGSYWLVLQPDDVSVCLQHPHFPIDLVVRADIAMFYQVWLGRLSYATAVEQRGVTLEGAPGLMRAFPQWFSWSPMREAVRAATTVA